MFFYKSFSSRPGKPPRRDIFIYIQYVKCSMKYSQAGRELLCPASNHIIKMKKEKTFNQEVEHFSRVLEAEISKKEC